MPRRSSPRSPSRSGSPSRRSGPKETGSGHWRRLSLRAWVLVLAGVVGVLLLLKLLGGEDVARLQGRAEAAAQASNWATSLELWRRINTTVGATSTTYLGEGRACLALGRAAQAERALRKAAAAAPSESEAWLLLLEVLRVEGLSIFPRIGAFITAWPGPCSCLEATKRAGKKH